jgi:F0F1-type ATP synthase delta subunit
MVKTKLDGKVASFLSLVNQSHRLAAIPEIASQFEAMKNKSEGAAEVMITSAFPIEGSALNDLLSSLKKRFGGKDLRQTIKIDPAITISINSSRVNVLTNTIELPTLLLQTGDVVVYTIPIVW